MQRQVKLSTQSLFKLISARVICDQLCAQQGHYMMANGLRKTPVDPTRIAEYASECERSLRREVRKCKNAAQLAKVMRAYSRLTRHEATTFLRAA